MKILIVLLVILLMGCTTLQQEYIRESTPPENIYLEVSGFIGVIIGIGVTSMTWYYYEKLY